MRYDEYSQDGLDFDSLVIDDSCFALVLFGAGNWIVVTKGREDLVLSIEQAPVTMLLSPSGQNLKGYGIAVAGVSCDRCMGVMI